MLASVRKRQLTQLTLHLRHRVDRPGVRLYEIKYGSRRTIVSTGVASKLMKKNDSSATTSAFIIEIYNRDELTQSIVNNEALLSSYRQCVRRCRRLPR